MIVFMGYREHPVPLRLQGFVECFWTNSIAPGNGTHRVMPDGCEDILWIPSAGTLLAVGTMTRAQIIEQADRQTVIGVRFRPGMARAFLPVPGHELTDTSAELASLWGKRGDRLRRQLSGADNADETTRLLSESLEPRETTRLHALLAWIEANQGRVRMEDLSRFSGLSVRHLRRMFLEETGVSPKMFCRVIRFRSLITRIWQKPPSDWATLALDSGYYDQSHLTNEFRELGGLTPHTYLNGRFFQD